MLFEVFHDEMRASMSAPVQVNGGGIGLMRCTREVMMSVSPFICDSVEFRDFIIILVFARHSKTLPALKYLRMQLLLLPTRLKNF